MKIATLFFLPLLFIWSCRTIPTPKKTTKSEQHKLPSIVDERDQNEYGFVEIGNQRWFTENLRFQTSNSVCYWKKKEDCGTIGRLYPSDELEKACPEGWRVPNINDWNTLKAHFQSDSIYALLDTIGWSNTSDHTNASGLSIQGTGYQMEKRLFFGEGIASTLWLNQSNKYEEYYHVHLYGGKGLKFEKSNFTTNEVFHAHPIEDLANRRFSIRCMCAIEQE